MEPNKMKNKWSIIQKYNYEILKINVTLLLFYKFLCILLYMYYF